ncbi:MAG: energy-coupling factor transporter transmembrane protein EcfT [Muribaculaceae bacterium]|nr:energy-coupling factor transporter transmembrane protein EcfT [Muribaculaceae bacterium]
MSKLEKSIEIIARAERGSGDNNAGPDACPLLITTIVYLVLMLSVPLWRPAMLLIFAIYPILASPLCGESFGRIFRKSLWVVPFIAFIGVFNPIFDHTYAFNIGGISISRGWLSFIEIIIRGLMAMQALVLLISCHGFIGICRALERIGVPAFLTTQLLMVFRYMRVLMEELLTMRRARAARGYGKKRYPLRMWGDMMGQLFLSTIDRSQRIHLAMLSRGFRGRIPSFSTTRRKVRPYDIAWVSLWTVALVAARFVDPSLYLSFPGI